MGFVLSQVDTASFDASRLNSSPTGGSVVSSEAAEIVYEFARLRSLEGWWVWAFLLFGVAILLHLLVRFYRRDAAELSGPVRNTLIGLRLVVLIGVIFLFCDLQRRTERTLTLPSEVAVVIDTSQSMTLAAGTVGAGPTREERAVELLDQTNLLTNFADNHRVNIYSFGQESEADLLQATGQGTKAGGTKAGGTKASENRGGGDSGQPAPATSGVQQAPPAKVGSDVTGQTQTNLIETSRDSGLASGEADAASLLAVFAAGAIVMGLVLCLLSFVFGWFRKDWLLGRALGSAAICLGSGLILLGGCYAVETERSLSSLLTGREWALADDVSAQDSDSLVDPKESDAAQSETESVDAINRQDESGKSLDWKSQLAATASQSRIGDAIRTVLNQHDPATLAGVVLITDGQNNGGSDVNAALSAARRNGISFYPVGMGSGDAPLNVRVVDLDAPRRVYPGDKFTVTATLQASGPSPIEIDVELLDGLEPVNGADQTTNPLTQDVIERRTITLPVDGSLIPIRFEMEPESVGRRRVAIRLLPPSVDQNPNDDLSDAKYEVVAKKLKVLAIAGGPTREYRFVRNLYYRDRSINLDVWLQTGQEGMSQDADRLLSRFPASAEELFEYDVVAMFDPDWTALTLSQIELLERWVSQQAGGLILVAGPVYHPQWIKLRTDPRVAKIAGLFPVTFSTRGAVIASGRQGGEAAWPLEMTQEARRAEFLWVADDADSSKQLWQDFSGVYDYVDTKDAKPGSKVYAYFSDPTTQTGGSLPVFLASQFYGAGRTYFQGSGELWRLRGQGDQYFQSYFTKLARWVSEGRLLRDSTRGVLLLDSPAAMVGDSISVRAVLSDEQFEPLDVPEVDAKILTPGGRIEDLRLLPLQGEPRAGTYGAQFVVRESGDYEVRLTLGDALNEQLLQQALRVRLPTTELERPRRNDELLTRLASLSNGKYFPMDESVSSQDVATSLIQNIQPRSQQSILPGTYDQEFLIRRNAVLMWLLATFLTMEWVVRRLHRLA